MLEGWDAECEVPEEPSSDPITYTVTHPSGAVGEFKLGVLRQTRHYVPRYCVLETATYRYLVIPNVTDSYGLFQKKITGPGLPAMTWTYNYTGGNELAFADICVNGGWLCDQRRTVTITGPNSTFSREEYGISYGINEGQLLKREVGSGPSAILETTTHVYADQADADSQPYPWQAGLGLIMYADPMRTQMRPLKRRVTNRQGNNFTWRADTFDAFARPDIIYRESDLSVPMITSRKEQTYYHDNLSLWVLGQVRRRTAAGTELERTDFNAFALPWKRYVNGVQVQTIAYNASGTVSWVSDGLNNRTTLANWYRGLPRLVTFADLTTRKATVDSRGWVTSTTNEANATTSYTYDSIGRITRVDYPAGDTTAWAPTTVSLIKGTGSAFGLPAGHWKQTTNRGTYRKEVYLDALWRPVLQREWQLGAATATIRYNGWVYDHANRVTFAGYPLASASSLASFINGTTTQYDALGRVTRVEQDSENGHLVTSTAYLPGLGTQVTNPRGHITLTTSRAWDDPDAAVPYLIQAPGGVTTNILLDVFDKPLAVTRAGSYGGQAVSATRHYFYDTQQRLCKRVEPETGATLFTYDAAGNLAWSAEGQALTDLELECDRASVPTSERVLRSYDSRNRLTLVDYPDSTPDVATTYTADGKVATIGRSPTLLTYAYNKLGLLTFERLQYGGINWLTSHSYNSLGHLTATTYPSGHWVPFAPNALGQATQAGPYATGATYYPNGALAGFTYGNGIVHTMTQNLRQLPERSRDVLGTSAVLDDSYDYDANGNVLAISDGLPSQAGNRDMTYDALDRLTSVAAGPAHGGYMGAAYDPLDNLRALDQGSRQYRYFYDGNNRLAQIKSPGGAPLHSFGYDARGNTISKDGSALNFDRENRLTSSQLLTPSSYVYDGLGRRVREFTGASTYFYYGQGGKLLYTNDHKTSSSTDHIYLGGSLVANRKVPSGSSPTIEVTYQHTDALGTPVAFTDANAQVVDDGRTTPWGEPADGQWVRRPGYTGHQMDAGAKLVYMQQRYYDPGVGRFLSVDPVTALDNGDMRHLNRYGYAYNSPYTFTDPDGRQARNGRGNPNPSFATLTTDQKREVAKIVAKSHQIDISRENIEIYPGRGAKLTANSLNIYEETFDSRSELAASIGHEIEMHLDVHITERGGSYGEPVDKVQHHLDESEAFQYNVDNAQRFNNTDAEVAHFESARDGHAERARTEARRKEQE